jgi:peptide chain release factor subunit 1
MKLISREQIANLAKFKSEKFLTTSFYLDTDKSRLSKKEITLSLKNLLSSGKSTLEKMNLSKDKKDSLSYDLEKIDNHCKHNLNSYNHIGLAVYSCSSQDFWEIFDLPGPPRNRVIFDRNPYVRPLSALLNEHKNICLLTLDRKEARWYKIFLGKISPLERIEGDVPSKVREGGWEGYESKRIERHIATHLHDFFKDVAQTTFRLFKEEAFDWLFLGCQDEYCKIFEPLLHPYLKKRMLGRIKMKPSDPQDTVLKKTVELEKKLKEKEESETLSRFISELESGGLATSGLKNTLRSLNRGTAQSLLITRYFSVPGRICPKCQFLFSDEEKCPSCQRKTDPLVDVIDEAVETAMEKRCQVFHINPPSRLRRYGNIGAFLRYKV